MDGVNTIFLIFRTFNVRLTNVKLYKSVFLENKKIDIDLIMKYIL